MYIYYTSMGSAAARRGFGGTEGRLFFNILNAPLQIIVSIGTSSCFFAHYIFFKGELRYLFIFYIVLERRSAYLGIYFYNVENDHSV